MEQTVNYKKKKENPRNRCEDCIFVNRNNRCTMKNQNIETIQYSNCWYFKSKDLEEENEYDDDNDLF